MCVIAAVCGNGAALISTEPSYRLWNVLVINIIDNDRASPSDRCNVIYYSSSSFGLTGRYWLRYFLKVTGLLRILVNAHILHYVMKKENETESAKESIDQEAHTNC